MRRIFTLLAAILLMASGWAQSPQGMSYQAVIRNAGDELVTTQIGMQISILKGSDVGTPVYVETQMPTPNANGLVTIEIGDGTIVTGTFAAINWSAGPYFVKTEVDPGGGTAYSVTGTSQLLSVPYALYTGHYIGERFGGGIVVSTWKVAGVEHGLIASLVELSPGYVAWSDVTGTATGATSQMNGSINTGLIVAQSTATSAADLCDVYTNADYGTGIYSDWYLPAVWELHECFKASYIVTSVLLADGFKFDYYWSSTEASATNAYYVGFHTNIFASDALKSFVAGYVRAVRQF